MHPVEILFNSAHGVYIPQLFARECDGWSGVTASDVEIMLAGPESDEYWEAWLRVLDRATYTTATGSVYKLHQGDSGDVFAYCHEIMSERQRACLFGCEY